MRDAPHEDAPPVDAALRDAILRELAGAPDGVSLSRLIKRLRVRMSVLMRALAWLGEEAIGAERGAGLVRVEQRGESQVAVLTVAGAEAAHVIAEAALAAPAERSR